MKIKILGLGGWEGIPAPFCNCRICKLAVETPTQKIIEVSQKFL